MFRPFFVILCALVLSVMSACTSDVVPIYSSQPAFLRYAPVPTAPPLLSALTSPGQWCSITYTHLQINISAPGHTTIPTPAPAPTPAPPHPNRPGRPPRWGAAAAHYMIAVRLL